ncbi:MAG TPA: CcoQ/FixQ family Cbb3-type cytochrome c oxidase assembly chaperone [Fluviicola sp.]|nr:CcoQ/FixQ family Cbb3-type cytochrome c oxidase assembly chaperone [Fluviicola sp.]
MLRFIKHHLTSEEGVQFYGIISLLIFTIFFGIVIIRMIRMSKDTVDELSNIPLENDEIVISQKDLQ